MKYEKAKVEIVRFGDEEFMVASPGWSCGRYYSPSEGTVCRNVYYVSEGYFGYEEFHCNPYSGFDWNGTFYCNDYA